MPKNSDTEPPRHTETLAEPFDTRLPPNPAIADYTERGQRWLEHERERVQKLEAQFPDSPTFNPKAKPSKMAEETRKRQEDFDHRLPPNPTLADYEERGQRYLEHARTKDAKRSATCEPSKQERTPYGGGAELVDVPTEEVLQADREHKAREAALDAERKSKAREAALDAERKAKAREAALDAERKAKAREAAYESINLVQDDWQKTYEARTFVDAAIRKLDGTYSLTKVHATACSIVDRLCPNMKSTQDSPDRDDFPLRDLEGECVEMSIRYKGGSSTVFGRVFIVNGDYACGTFIQIAEARLPADAFVRRQCAGKGFVFESTKYKGNDR